MSAAHVDQVGPAARGVALVGVAIVLTGLNLRTAVTSVGPVLQEVSGDLALTAGATGLLTAVPVLCFAVLGFAGPPLAARFRDGHVLAAAMLLMTLGQVARALAGGFPLFLVGTAVAMAGGALGNVLLPGLVKRWFPHRTGLLVGAYTTAMAVGAAASASATAPVADAVGPGGWRWALGLWAVFSLLAVLPWLAVPALPGASRGAHRAVAVGALLRSPLARTMALLFGVQAMQAYVFIGWGAQYLRDQGLSAAAAGLLLGLNGLVGIPVNIVVPLLTVRARLQRPLLLGFVACYLAGWTGLLLAPLTAPWAWVVLFSLGTGCFAMVLTLLGLRARTPESTAALSTLTQGVGYLIAGVGPLLVGVLRGATGGYTGMFVVVYAALAVMTVTGWRVCRERYVDDELPAGRTGGEAVPALPGAVR